MGSGGAGRSGTESGGGWRSQKDAGDLHREFTMLRENGDTISNLRKGSKDREPHRFPLKENGEISELRGKWSALSRHPRWQGGGCQEDRKPTEVQGHTPYNAQDTKVPGKGCEILMLFIAAKVTNPGRKNSHEPSICIL